MSDWQVFWTMFIVVWVLWAVGVKVHEARRRYELQHWNERFGPRRGGPPRVVP